MANVIKIKRSTTVNTPAALDPGELAYSEPSDTLFIGSNAGAVIAISGSGQFLKTSNLLTQVKLVDGAGSGLDADLLDGNEGSYFRDAGNLNAGTLPAARFNDVAHGNRGGGAAHSAATTLANGFMSSGDKTKLDGVATGANNYTLPVAGVAKGGVKEGGDISIDASGNMTVNDDSHDHVISNVDGLQSALDAKLATSGGTVSGALTVAGNLTVNGTTTSVNTNQVDIGDSIITLNSDETGAPSQDGGIEIERGTSANVKWTWVEANDEWSANNQRLGGVVDPVNGSQIGDRDYNDGRYALDDHTHSYDNYGSWNIKVNGGASEPISSSEAVNFVAGGNTTISRSGSTITIASSGTSYSAGTGLSLSGSTFAIGNHSAAYITSGTLSDSRLSSSVLKSSSTIDGGTF